MKAPDKIYIYTANVGDNHYSISSTDNPVDKKYEVEYIRKDALLELIEKTVIFYKEKIQEGEPWSEIRLEVCEHLISKIESL